MDVHVTLFVVQLSAVMSMEANSELHVIGLFPTTHKRRVGEVGRGVKPAVELAVERVNSHPSLLHGWSLKVNWNDTECDMAVATRLFFDTMHKNTTKIILFGDVCFNVTGPMTQIAKYWDMAQLSYADTNPILSDRKKYENFFRTVPSDTDFNPARLALLRRFGWKKVGTIFQDASKSSSRYAYSHNKLLTLLERNNVTIIQVESFANDPDGAIKHLKDKDVRIIIGNFDPRMARRVFCSAYKRGLYGPNFQWIILGDYPKNWWKHRDDRVNCTKEELNETLYGYIATGVLPLSSSKGVTYSGLTPKVYLEEYNKRRANEYSKFHGYAFDGIWVIANAFDRLLKKRKKRELAENRLKFKKEEVNAALNATYFHGVTGPVKFYRGDRIGGILFEQFQGGHMMKIGEYYQLGDHLNLSVGSGIIWRDGRPPLDGYKQIKRMERVSILLYVILSTSAGIGIIMAFAFLAFNIKFRKHRYIKMSSPNMNNIIVAGCILTYVSVFLLGTDGRMLSKESFPYMCTARAWVLSVGFTLAFGAMFSKTWRVHAIFTNIKLNKKVIKDYKLVLIVGVLLVLDSVILGTWWGYNRFLIMTKELTHEIKGDEEIIPVVEFCTSKYMTIWMASIYAYKGLLLVIGCFLAWETRHVSIPALNDSKYIGMSVYNVVIMCVCGAAVSFIINDQPNSAFVIIGFFIIFCTTITLCLVFVPKIVELRRDPTGDERRIRATLKKPSAKRDSSDSSELHQKVKTVTDENTRVKEILEANYFGLTTLPHHCGSNLEKNKEVKELLEQLGEDPESYSSCKKTTPIHKKVKALRNIDTSPSKYSRSTINSDGDNASMMSDVSGTTSIWQVDSPSGQRIYFHLRSVDESSCTEAIELMDLGPKSFSKLSPITSSEECMQKEADDDPFGGVYLGPPDTVPTKRESTVAVHQQAKEEHPLVHKYSSITFLDGANGDEDSTESLSKAEQRSIRSGSIPEHEDEFDATTSLLA